MRYHSVVDTSITITDGDLWQLIETISRRTGMSANELVHIALWDFVRSIDLDYEELREGPVYRNGAGKDSRPEAHA